MITTDIAVTVALLVTPVAAGLPVAVGRGPQWLHLLQSVSYVLLLGALYVVGPWAHVGMWLRPGVLAMGLVFVLIGFVRPLRPPRGWAPWRLRLEAGIHLLLAGLFGAAFVSGLLGRVPADRPPLDVALPLTDGRFYVGKAGTSALTNHHLQVDEGQHFALDIVALGPAGHRGMRFLPRENADFAVWEAPVVAPCAGEVTAARDDLPDVPGGDLAAGNHVLLACGEATLMLAHLRQDSVVVAPGERVAPGDALGRVGNSGNSTEPHLHVHAVSGRTGDVEAAAYELPALPLRFDGHWLVANDVRDRRDPDQRPARHAGPE